MNGRRSKQLRKWAVGLATKSSILKQQGDGSLRYQRGSARWWYQKLKKDRLWARSEII